MSSDELIERFPFPPVIDNTMRQAWWTCPHLFFRQHIQGLRRADLLPDGERRPTANIHLHFGAALAAGLAATREIYHRTRSEPTAIIEGAETVLRVWGDSSNAPAPTTRNEENKTLSNCLLAHEGYFRYFQLDDPQHEIATLGNEPLVERSGACPIPGVRHPVTGEPLLYAGRFDAIVTRAGKLWGLDDKSTGSNVDSASWRSQWTLSGQFTGYAWLAREWGFSLDGFLIHGIQVLKDSTRYSEAMTPRPHWMIDAWLRQLSDDVVAMIDQYANFLSEGSFGDVLGRRGHPFAQALGAACHAYNRPCSFLDDICAQPNPEQWVDYSFVVERWNPLAPAAAPARGDEQ